MALPTIPDSGTGFQATPTTNHSVAIPAAPGVGNILLVLFNTADSTTGMTPPSGFVPVGLPDPNNQLTGRWNTTAGPLVFAKRSNGTESTPVTFVTDANAYSTHIWIEIANVSDDLLFDGIRITQIGNNSTSVDPPNNALPDQYGWNDSDILYLAVASIWTNINHTLTAPATYTALHNVFSAPSQIAVAYKSVTGLSEDPGAFSALNVPHGWVALTIAIRNNDNQLPTPRVGQFTTEITYAAEPAVRTTQFHQEVTYGAVPALNVSQYVLEVAYIEAQGNSDWYFRILRRDDDMTLVLKQSTASQTVVIGPFIDDTDFKTPETALSIANTDIKLSKNGASAVNKNSGGATHLVNGEYAITLDATDTSAIGELRISVVVAGALPVIRTFQVVEEVVFDALYAVDAPGFTSVTNETTINNIENILNEITGDTFNSTTMNLEEIFNILNENNTFITEIQGPTYNSTTMNLEEIFNLITENNTYLTEIQGDTFNESTHNLVEIYNAITEVDTLIQQFRGGTFNIDTDTLENIYNTLIEIPASGDWRIIERPGKDSVTYKETLTTEPV